MLEDIGWWFANSGMVSTMRMTLEDNNGGGLDLQW